MIYQYKDTDKLVQYMIKYRYYVGTAVLYLLSSIYGTSFLFILLDTIR